MNKHVIIASLFIAGSITAPALALKSITDMFKDPKIAKVSFEMQSPAYRAQALEQLTAQVETPYSALHAKMGDKTTMACEEELSTLMLKIFRDALKGSVSDNDFTAITTTYTKLYTHLSSKAGMDAEELNGFISLIIARRITVAGLEFSIENAGKIMTQQQQVQCAQAIQQVNDITMDFMIEAMGLAVEDDATQPAEQQK